MPTGSPPEQRRVKKMDAISPSNVRFADIRFLIIGATKSATTWLQRSLQTDRRVCMPGPELHYFSRHYDRGPEWYLAQFPQIADGQFAGEKSNSYLEEPAAAERIHDALPDARLIVQLRNPIERAYSDYCMLVRRGEVGKDIDSQLDPRRAEDGRFLAGGRYYSQLAPYLERYGEDRILIVLYEDMKSDAVAHLERVREFLGLDGAASAVPVEEKVKDRTTPVVSPGLRRILRPLKPIVSPLRGHPYFRALRARIARTPRYAALSPDLRDRLVEYYAEEAAGLGRLMGRDLTHWLKETPSADRTPTSARQGADS